jgi:hypothetical protein
MHARKSRREWSAIVKAFERSGESHAEFCAKRGLKVWSFRTWLYRMRREGAASRTTDLVLLPVAVTTPGTTEVPQPSALVVAVANVEVRVAVGTDVAYVAGLVAELRSRC